MIDGSYGDQRGPQLERIIAGWIARLRVAPKCSETPEEATCQPSPPERGEPLREPPLSEPAAREALMSSERDAEEQGRDMRGRAVKSGEEQRHYHLLSIYIIHE